MNTQELKQEYDRLQEISDDAREAVTVARDAANAARVLWLNAVANESEYPIGCIVEETYSWGYKGEKRKRRAIVKSIRAHNDGAICRVEGVYLKKDGTLSLNKFYCYGLSIKALTVVSKPVQEGQP